MRKKRALDLFCGAGGLTEGLRQAGFNVVAGVELDASACATYRLNHPAVKLWETDIGRVTGPVILRRLNMRRGDLDLIAACPPCQGFSSLRTKNGGRRVRDRRNDLIYDVLRLARSMNPKAIMMENVPGLAGNRRYFRFVRALESHGYFVAWKILDTADYGVPQRRRRLVLLASRLRKPSFARTARTPRTVRQYIGHLSSPAQSRDPLHNYSVKRSSKVEALIRRVPRNGGSRSALGSHEQLKCHRRFEGFSDVYGRMKWNAPGPTITSGCTNPSKGRFIHPSQHRAITLREAALLQTFPRSYRVSLTGGREVAALLIGNALPPEFIRRHALALRKSGLTPPR